MALAPQRHRDPLLGRTRGVVCRLAGWWQRRRERTHLCRPIDDFFKLDDHLLQDIGVDPLVLRYGSAGIHPQARGYQASLEMTLHGGVLKLAPLRQRS
jgi:hypothetical protein